MKTPALVILVGLLYLTSCLFMLWESRQKKNIIRCLLFLASYCLLVVNHIENDHDNQMYEGYFAAADSATRVNTVKITDLHTGGDTTVTDPVLVRALKKAFIEVSLPNPYSITKDLFQRDWVSDKDLNEEICTLKFYTEPDGELLKQAEDMAYMGNAKKSWEQSPRCRNMGKRL